MLAHYPIALMIFYILHALVSIIYKHYLLRCYPKGLLPIALRLIP